MTRSRAERSGDRRPTERGRLVRHVAVVAALSLTTTLNQLAVPTPAGAATPPGGSIVHVKGSDVWLTSPDGAKKVQVTTDGATPSPDKKGSSRYSFPSQSDDGKIIVAGRDEPEGFSKRGYLWVMDRQGVVLAKFAPPQFEQFPDPACGGFLQLPRGISSAEVSPDGKKIVYESYADLRRTDCTWTSHRGTAVVNLDGTGHMTIRRASNGSDFRLGHPTWVTSSRLLVHSDAVDTGLKWVDLPDPAARDWTSISATQPDLEADRLIGLGLFNETMDFWSANGGPPSGTPTFRGQIGWLGSGISFHSPTWARGGGAVAWVEYSGSSIGDQAWEGIVMESIPDLTTFFNTGRDVGTLIVPGGTDPSWGPAPVTLPSEDEAEGDYDGNGSTDVAVYRPSTGAWYVQSPFSAVTWGVPGDVPVPGDYDGNGSTEHAVYRPSTGVWYLLGSNPRVLQWGVTGDVPVPGDYDGNGTTDVAVYRPSTGAWYVQSPFSVVTWGVPGDIPVPGDYDGNGSTEHAVYRPSTGVWYLLGTNPRATHWGVTGDVPVPGDYDGNGTTDVGVYRPSTGVWYVQSPFSAVTWGVPGDVPVPGDYDGNGSTEQAVYRPSTGVWYLLGTNPRVTHWGVTGDIPLALPQAVYQRFF